MAASTPITSSRSSAMSAVKSPDIQFAIALILMIFMLVVPLPPLILDIFLSVSITIGFFILLVAIYVKEPLDFSTFPTILLLTTLFRLALNVATTRSILLEGANGEVSDVVRSFGEFVVGGNYFVGFTIFVILVIVNFIVITKGAGRVAEVGARFTLDAMPGKQMSIDAELNAGLIDKDEAKRRRKKIESESDFYGAMDGASKFVRGDAIAGIVITAINIIVGLIIGVTQYGLSFSQSAEVFTLLTVGDGLVSQIPSLIISTAAGIVVTRTNSDEGLSSQLTQQMAIHPKAMWICSGLLGVLAFIPGLPNIPFIILSVAFLFLGRKASRNYQRKEQLRIEDEAKAEQQEDRSSSIETLLHVDTLSLEVGVDLIPLVDTQQDGEILERIVSARKQFAQEMGIIVPMVMVRDNIHLKPSGYQILLKGNVLGGGTLVKDHYLAMEPAEVSEPLTGIKAVEPAYGLSALWIREAQKEEAAFRGYTVVNCATVVVTHLNKLIQENAQSLIGRQEVQNLVARLQETHPKVVEEVIGAERLTLGEVVAILQNLLAEGVSIRDFLTIFETLADHSRSIKNPEILTRYVRKALGRGIIKKYLSDGQKLYVTSLDRSVEDLLISHLQQNEDGTSSLNIDPAFAEKLLNSIATNMKNFDELGSVPVLICGARIRSELRRLINHFIPGVAVIAVDEIPTDTILENVGLVSLN